MLYYSGDNKKKEYKMKKLVIIIVLLIIGCLYGINKLNNKMYEECMASGKHSQETCEFEVYYR